MMDGLEQGRARIMFVIAHLGEGGSQRVATTMAERLRQSADITIAAYSSPGEDLFPVPDGVARLTLDQNTNRKFKFSRVLRSINRVRALRSAIQNEAPTCVFGFIGPTNILVILAAIGLNVRVVISERNDPSKQSFGFIWDLLRKFLYRRADVVTANSNAAIEVLKSYVPGKKLVFLPNPTPAKAESRNEENMVLAVGRLTPQKGHERLLKAFSESASANPGWKLVILGEGPSRGLLTETARNLGIADSLSLPGFVDPYPYYERAAIFALPSEYEGTPNALLEAMASGITPIVLADTGGASATIKHDENGLIADTADGLARCLKILMENANKRSQFGRAAQISVDRISRSDIDDIWRMVLDINQEASSGNLPRPAETGS